MSVGLVCAGLSCPHLSASITVTPSTIVPHSHAPSTRSSHTLSFRVALHIRDYSCTTCNNRYLCFTKSAQLVKLHYMGDGERANTGEGEGEKCRRDSRAPPPKTIEIVQIVGVCKGKKKPSGDYQWRYRCRGVVSSALWKGTGWGRKLGSKPLPPFRPTAPTATVFTSQCVPACVCVCEHIYF